MVLLSRLCELRRKRTGIVHIAPAYGEEDKVVTDAAHRARDAGQHARRVRRAGSAYQGQHVFEANKAIIRDLKASGALLRPEATTLVSALWRCDSPTHQRDREPWFVAVTKFRDRLLELNKQIHWVPRTFATAQFGKWRRHARDWRSRENDSGDRPSRWGV